MLWLIIVRKRTLCMTYVITYLYRNSFTIHFLVLEMTINYAAAAPAACLENWRRRVTVVPALILKSSGASGNRCRRKYRNSAARPLLAYIYIYIPFVEFYLKRPREQSPLQQWHKYPVQRPGLWWLHHGKQ